PATRLHGHTYRLEVVVRGARLNEEGVLFDLGRLQAAVGDLIATLDYRDLATVAGLAGVNTTMEAVADYCWAKLAAGRAGAAAPRRRRRGSAAARRVRARVRAGMSPGGRSKPSRSWATR